MGMGIYKLGVLAVVAFLSAIAAFIGAVMLIASLQNGSITINYTSGGKSMSETVTRAADAARYWRLFLLLGVLPLVGGAGALWYSVRKLRGN